MRLSVGQRTFARETPSVAVPFRAISQTITTPLLARSSTFSAVATPARDMVHSARPVAARSWTAQFDRLRDGWHPDTDLPDLSGKVALVTGGSVGLGYETAARLAEHNCKVYLLASKEETAGRAAEELRRRTGSEVIPIPCDLFDLRNVTATLRDLRKQLGSGKLDILFLNAGIFFPGPYQRTPQGFEQQLGVNYFAQVLLALGLMDKVMDSAPSRVVFQSSEAEAFGKLEWENLKGDKWSDSGMVPYGTSKLFQIMFAKALQEPLHRSGRAVDVFAVHPGLVNTPLMDKVDGKEYPDGGAVSIASRIVGLTPGRGALPGVYAAASTEAQGQGFKHFGPSKLGLWPYTARGEANPSAKDIPACRRLFSETVKILQDAVGPKEWGPIEAAAREVLQRMPATARV